MALEVDEARMVFERGGFNQGRGGFGPNPLQEIYLYMTV